MRFNQARQGRPLGSGDAATDRARLRLIRPSKLLSDAVRAQHKRVFLGIIL